RPRMKAISKAIVLCVALSASLAQAQELALRDPLWARSGRVATPDAPIPQQWRTPFQVVMGFAAGAAVAIPAAYAGFQIANRALPPDYYCDLGVCDYGFPFGGVAGAFAGTLLGFSLGTGFGVAWAGLREGGAFNWAPALIGSALGGVAAMTASVVLGVLLGANFFFSLGLIAVPALIATGAIVGSVWSYQASLPFGPPPPPPDATVVPTVRLVPGGGVVGFAVAL